ncbi:MAG: hypothetical protein HYW89_01915 [Candidatus Sungiibacteriota bacterium]|uniref:Uncharacterized protein n=1 Tax=Candidatus Sungiibacteriota bacterium TaxID=2750080 RepID=A0A7T5RK80_9BACT|nr:MAG: hypothetical protein HYW89_01915 [Candidatus Sungbacteria bacterium]
MEPTPPIIKIIFKILALAILIVAALSFIGLWLQVFSARADFWYIIRAATLVLLNLVGFYGFWNMRTWLVSILLLNLINMAVSQALGLGSFSTVTLLVVVGIFVLVALLRRHLSGRYEEPLPLILFIGGALLSHIAARFITSGAVDFFVK